VAALTADTAPTGITGGQFAIVETGDVNNAENSRLYLWTGTVYSYVSDLSGNIGITGPQGATGVAGTIGVDGSTGATGPGQFFFGNTTPVGAVAGDHWLDTVTMIETVLVNDGDSTQWVEITSRSSSAVTRSLNNLANVAINTSLLPAANVTYDLGSSSLRWRDLYLSGNTIDLGGTAIKSSANGVSFTSSANADAVVALTVSSIQIGSGANVVTLVAGASGLQTVSTTGNTIPVGAGGFSYANTVPASAQVGDRWINSDNLRQFVYVTDGTSTQWVEPTSTGLQGIQGATGATGPVAGSSGQVIYNSSGQPAGSANLTFDGTTLNTQNLVLAGNLTVNGTTTTINSTTLSIDDKNIVLADGAANSAAADGAGITVAGASATLTYTSSSDSWSVNKNLGIGTTSPAGPLEVIGTSGILITRSSKTASTSSSARILGGAFTGNTATAIFLDGVGGENRLNIGGGTGTGEPATSIKFYTGTAGATSAGTERMTIDATGVGIGTNSPAAKLHVNGTYGTTATGGVRLTGLGSTTGDLSPIAFYLQSSGWGTQHQATITAQQVSGANGGANLLFGTSADGSAGPTTRMTLDASGRLLVNLASNVYNNSKIQATASSGPTLGIQQTTNTEYVSGYWNSSSTAARKLVGFFYGSSGSQHGSIESSGTTMLFYGAGGNGISIDISNNVGIGTSSPNQRLDVRGYVVSDVNGNAVEGGFYVGNSGHGIRRAAGTNDVYLYTNGGTLYLGANGSSTNQVTVLTGGSVGIGTNNPNAKLTVSIGTATSGTVARFSAPSYDDVYIAAGQSSASCGIGTVSTSQFNIFVNSTSKIAIDNSGHVTPAANGTQNLGSTSLRWGTVYTSDLSLNNGIGDWTIVEGEDDLFIYNNRSNKVYKFKLEEVDPALATPKRG
jgi:hypothetical protein